MDQDLFDWDDPTDKPAEAEEPEPKWNWWDPWPSGLTHREGLMRQISRDRRALQECELEEERTFYAQRIAAYWKELTVTASAPSTL